MGQVNKEQREQETASESSQPKKSESQASKKLLNQSVPQACPLQGWRFDNEVAKFSAPPCAVVQKLGDKLAKNSSHILLASPPGERAACKCSVCVQMRALQGLLGDRNLESRLSTEGCYKLDCSYQQFRVVKNEFQRLEMTQQVAALTALTEGSGLPPSSHRATHNHCSSSPRGIQ